MAPARSECRKRSTASACSRRHRARARSKPSPSVSADPAIARTRGARCSIWCCTSVRDDCPDRDSSASLTRNFGANVADVLDGRVEPATQRDAAPPGHAHDGALRAARPGRLLALLDVSARGECRQRAIDDRAGDSPHPPDGSVGAQRAYDRPAVSRVLRDETEHDPVGHREVGERGRHGRQRTACVPGTRDAAERGSAVSGCVRLVRDDAAGVWAGPVSGGLAVRGARANCRRPGAIPSNVRDRSGRRPARHRTRPPAPPS